jgi:transcription-repair coupling factor (superfamily II helicase)
MRRGTRRVIREALLREHYRGGQASSSCPRIADLPESRSSCASRCPEVKVVVAHGQMAPTELEDGCRPSTTASTTCCCRPRSSKRARHPDRQHADRPPRRHVRPRPALPAARPRRPGEDPRLRLFTTPARRRSRETAEAAEGAAVARQPRRRLPARQPRPRHPRRRQSARRRAVGATSRRSASSSTSRCWRRRSRGEGRRRRAARRGFSPQITVDAPIMIPEEYVPDLDLGWASTGASTSSRRPRRSSLRRRDDRPLRFHNGAQRKPW